MRIETKIEMLEGLKAWLERYDVHINEDNRCSTIRTEKRSSPTSIVVVSFPIDTIINADIVQDEIIKLDAELAKCPFCGSELMREHNIRGHYLHCVNDDCRYSGPFCNSIKEAEKQNHFAFGVLTLLRENGEQNED